MIGGDVFYNSRSKLPAENGCVWYEADIEVELLRKAKYYCKDLNPDAPRLKLIEIVDGDKRIEIK